MPTFLLLITFLLLLTGCGPAEPEYRTAITMKEIMDSIIDPNADYLWGSVSVLSTAKGFVEKAPKTNEDWLEERRHAISLMEAANLLQIPGRRVALPGEKATNPGIEEPPEVIQTLIDSDRAKWTQYAHELYDAGSLMLKAIDGKNVPTFEAAGEDVDKACESCHVHYWYPHQFDYPGNNLPSGSVRKRGP
ncbi:MAG: cytochrome c [Acidobacteriota bacterium]|nr:cytochrome c [Acidobacteriota bacterium]